MTSKISNQYLPEKKRKGFILVETIVAVSIILLVVPGVLDMAIKGMSLGTYAKTQMIANYLAAEGIEYVRSERDHNFLTNEVVHGSVAWDNGFAVCKTNPCTINPLSDPLVSPIIQACAGGSISSNPPSACYRLYVTPNGFYTHSSVGNTMTPFWRGVTVSDVSPVNPDERIITSTVVWDTQFSQKKIVVTDYIANWLQ